VFTFFIWTAHRAVATGLPLNEEEHNLPTKHTKDANVGRLSFRKFFRSIRSLPAVVGDSWALSSTFGFHLPRVPAPEWSHGDASNIDGQTEKVETSGSE